MKELKPGFEERVKELKLSESKQQFEFTSIVQAAFAMQVQGLASFAANGNVNLQLAPVQIMYAVPKPADIVHQVLSGDLPVHQDRAQVTTQEVQTAIGNIQRGLRYITGRNGQ